MSTRDVGHCAHGSNHSKPDMHASACDDAGLDAHPPGGKLLEEGQHVSPPQLPTNDHRAGRINAVDLDLLCPDLSSRSRLPLGSIESWSPQQATTSLALTCRWRSRSTASTVTNRGGRLRRWQAQSDLRRGKRDERHYIPGADRTPEPLSTVVAASFKTGRPDRLTHGS